MNCKQGDLAVVVRSGAGNEGKIVRCLRFVGETDGYDYDGYLDDCWLVDVVLNGTLRNGRVVSDSRLRPLRDQDGVDEVLRIAGKPQEVTA